jgi:hypothetical protein
VQTLVEQVAAVLRVTGQAVNAPRDAEMDAIAERHHARLMAALRAAEEAAQSLGFRPREAGILAQGLHRVLDQVGEQARTLRYGLLALLAQRAIDLVAAVERNPSGGARASTAISRALSTLITAMKRVAHNRMEGDGGEAGLKLLTMIDGITAPVRASLG